MKVKFIFILTPEKNEERSCNVEKRRDIVKEKESILL